MDKGIITFFEVSHDGFYKRDTPDSDGEKVAGSMLETLGLLGQWVNQRGFTATLPWDLESKKNKTPIYTKNVYTDPITNDSLFVFWKGDLEQEENKNGIKADAKTDANSKDSVLVQKGVDRDKVIQGSPMYYWFIPEKNLIATIQFPHSNSSSEEVFSYIKKCIDYRINVSDTKVEKKFTTRERDGEIGTVKIPHFISKHDDKRIYFKFNARVKFQNSNSVNISSLSKEITHIVVRDVISTTVKEDKSAPFQLLDLVFGKKNNKVKREVEIIEKRTVTVNELQKLLDVHKEQINSENEWCDVGFMIEGSSGAKFFSSYINRPRFLINKSLSVGSYYPAEQVLKLLLRERDDLLSVVNQQVVSEREEISA